MLDFLEFKNRVSAIKVAPELLGEAMVTIAKLPPDERRIFENRAACVVELVTERGYGEDSGLLAMAITIRLMALDSVADDSLIREWALPSSEPGITYIHADLLKVAVEEPVTEDPGGRPIFAVDSFRRELLRLAAARGRA